MSDLFSSATELAEERSAIREFDGLMTREEAERLGKLDAEEWRHSCEVRTVARMELFERREFIDRVEKQRGKLAAEKLRDGLRKEWTKRKDNA